MVSKGQENKRFGWKIRDKLLQIGKVCARTLLVEPDAARIDCIYEYMRGHTQPHMHPHVDRGHHFQRCPAYPRRPSPCCLMYFGFVNSEFWPGARCRAGLCPVEGGERVLAAALLLGMSQPLALKDDTVDWTR